MLKSPAVFAAGLFSNPAAGRAAWSGHTRIPGTGIQELTGFTLPVPRLPHATISRPLFRPQPLPFICLHEHRHDFLLDGEVAGDHMVRIELVAEDADAEEIGEADDAGEHGRRQESGQLEDDDEAGDDAADDGERFGPGIVCRQPVDPPRGRSGLDRLWRYGFRGDGRGRSGLFLRGRVHFGRGVVDDHLHSGAVFSRDRLDRVGDADNTALVGVTVVVGPCLADRLAEEEQAKNQQGGFRGQAPKVDVVCWLVSCQAPPP